MYKHIRHINTVGKMSYFMSKILIVPSCFFSFSPISPAFKSALKLSAFHGHGQGYVLKPVSAHMDTTVTERGKLDPECHTDGFGRLMHQYYQHNITDMIIFNGSFGCACFSN